MAVVLANQPVDLAGNKVVATSFGFGVTGQNASASSVSIHAGTGAPTQTAVKGSLYVQTDATTTTTRLYINTDGAGTWASFTASA